MVPKVRHGLQRQVQVANGLPTSWRVPFLGRPLRTVYEKGVRVSRLPAGVRCAVCRLRRVEPRSVRHRRLRPPGEDRRCRRARGSHPLAEDRRRSIQRQGCTARCGAAPTPACSGACSTADRLSGGSGCGVESHRRGNDELSPALVRDAGAQGANTYRRRTADPTFVPGRQAVRDTPPVPATASGVSATGSAPSVGPELFPLIDGREAPLRVRMSRARPQARHRHATPSGSDDVGAAEPTGELVSHQPTARAQPTACGRKSTAAAGPGPSGGPHHLLRPAVRGRSPDAALHLLLLHRLTTPAAPAAAASANISPSSSSSSTPIATSAPPPPAPPPPPPTGKHRKTRRRRKKEREEREEGEKEKKGATRQFLPFRLTGKGGETSRSRAQVQRPHRPSLPFRRRSKRRHLQRKAEATRRQEARAGGIRQRSRSRRRRTVRATAAGTVRATAATVGNGGNGQGNGGNGQGNGGNGQGNGGNGQGNGGNGGTVAGQRRQRSGTTAGKGKDKDKKP